MYLYLVFFYKLAYAPQDICPLAVGVFVGRNIPHSPVRENTFGWYIPPSLIGGIFHQVKALFKEYTKPMWRGEAG